MLKYNNLSDLLARSFEEFASNDAFEESGKNVFTYRETHKKTCQIEGFLTEKGVERGGRIAICTDKSLDTLVCILGTILQGSVYIPMDILAPTKRIQIILDDSQATGLIGDGALVDALIASNKAQDKWPIPGTSLQYVLLKKTGAGKIKVPKDLAYILYTSGSTGTPKGVMITHTNALSFIQWGATTFTLSSKDIFSSVAPFHFDLSVFDIFVAIWHGSKVVLMNNKTIRNPLMISELIEQKAITVWYSTPTALMLLQRYGKLNRYNHESLRIVNFAGEVFPKTQLKQLKQAWPEAQFYNLYGPTETNVCTWKPIPDVLESDFSSSNIGKCCAHLDCRILDINKEIKDPIPGQRGELIVSGASVSPGYLDLPAERQNSLFQDNQNSTWYKTGDLVHVNNQGEFEFIGRTDRMIKRNGYRVELNEIEKTLEQHDAIDRVCVINCKSKDQVILRAFIQGNTTEPTTRTSLKPYASDRLPSHMIPDEWVWINQIPLTSTQKIDYQKLIEWEVIQ